MKVLLTLHTSAGDEYTTRVKAGVQEQRSIVAFDSSRRMHIGGLFSNRSMNTLSAWYVCANGTLSERGTTEPKIPATSTGSRRNRTPRIAMEKLCPDGVGKIDLQAKNIVARKRVMSVLREFQLSLPRKNETAKGR